MQSGIRLCTLLILFTAVHGLNIAVSEEYRTDNPFPGEDIYYSKGVSYQSKIVLNELFLVNVKKDESPNCNLTNSNISDSYFVSGVKKLPIDGLVLVQLSHSVVIVDTGPEGFCRIYAVVNAECMTVVTRANSFDCFPRFSTEKLIERYSYKGQKEKSSFKISTLHENVSRVVLQSTELEKPEDKMKLLLWELKGDKETSSYKVYNFIC